MSFCRRLVTNAQGAKWQLVGSYATHGLLEICNGETSSLANIRDYGEACCCSFDGRSRTNAQYKPKKEKVGLAIGVESVACLHG
jgi:hypothetical protein